MIGAGGGIGAGVGTDVVVDLGLGADIFVGPDGGLSGSSGDGDSKLGVVTDGDGDKCDVVGDSRSGRFKCLAANISSRRF